MLKFDKTTYFPAGKYWSARCPKDTPFQRPLNILLDHPGDIPICCFGDVFI